MASAEAYTIDEYSLSMQNLKKKKSQCRKWMGVLPAVALCRHKPHDPSEIKHEKKLFFQIYPWLIVDVAGVGEKHEFQA